MATAKERYDALQPDRQQFLNRARHNAMLTIPSLLPLEGQDGQSHLVEPYQSLGSEGVVNLSSRVTMAMLPAGRPHLRLDIPPFQLMQMNAEVDEETNKDLAKGEKLIQAAVEKANWRGSTLQALQQLIVAGNVVEEFLDDQSFAIHRLDHFVVRRSKKGHVVEAVIHEMWDRELEGNDDPATHTSASPAANDDEVDVYTYIRLMSDGLYHVSQQFGDGSAAGNLGLETFDKDALRYSFLRWNESPGEDYGRSKVEEVIADLRSLDSLSKQALELGGMAAKNFIMIRPGANANSIKNRINRITNGESLIGDPESVDMKQFDTRTAQQGLEVLISKLESRISRTFLLLSTQQRSGDRVTATEIERDIQELESVLGGTFSVLSLTQLERRTTLLLEDMKAKKQFPDVGKDALQPTILTGLEALSRERDVGRAQQAGQIVQQFGEEGIRYVKLGVVLNKALVGLGIPEAVRTDAEVQEEKQREAAQAQQLAATAPAVTAAAGRQPQENLG
jgi:hypothetical protein